jgi:hypothetical protein
VLCKEIEAKTLRILWGFLTAQKRRGVGLRLGKRGVEFKKKVGGESGKN